MKRVALVTGASRGIGRCGAVALARAGYDVAITARTVHEGEGRADPVSTRDTAAPLRLPGSIERTAQEIEALERRALGVPMDLLDRRSVVAAFDAVMAEFGRIDVLVNNAVYEGPGLSDLFLDFTVELAERVLHANFISHLLLTQRVLPTMLERGGGIIINMTSAVARHDPPGPANEAGWGLGHAASKGAFDRMAGVIHAEFAKRGIRVYNVDPGLVMTEAMKIRGMEALFAGRMFSAPPEVPGAVIGWLASSPDAVPLAGTRIEAQPLCAKLKLVAGFSLPTASGN
jgi:NAD(P)-dependent dehydrogenase (short-subunit alcohol dehydrogenase family)